MEPAIKDGPLFEGLTEDEIEGCLACCGARRQAWEKGALVFRQGEAPRSLYILLEGAVAVCQDNPSGSRRVLTTMRQPGEMFGEVYLFLAKDRYDYYALALSQAKVLEMPRAFFYHNCSRGCSSHGRLIRNMLGILAEKAYLLNQKLQLMSADSLRQKIARFLLQSAGADGRVHTNMNREEMAEFLGAARPSLSRELMRMRAEGLIDIQGREISVRDFPGLESWL